MGENLKKNILLLPETPRRNGISALRKKKMAADIVSSDISERIGFVHAAFMAAHRLIAMCALGRHQKEVWEDGG